MYAMGYIPVWVFPEQVAHQGVPVPWLKWDQRLDSSCPQLPQGNLPSTVTATCLRQRMPRKTDEAPPSQAQQATHKIPHYISILLPWKPR